MKKAILLSILLLCAVQDVSARDTRESTAHVNTHEKCTKYVVQEGYCTESDNRCKFRYCGINEKDFQKNFYFGEKQLKEHEKEHNLKCGDYDPRTGHWHCYDKQ